MINMSTGIYLACFLVIILKVFAIEEVCDRRPLGTKTAPLPPDNRFFIDIDTIGDKYIPKRRYKVQLYSSDNSSSFIAFTISIREDTAYNERNPRKPKNLDPGQLFPSPNSNDVKVHHACKNTVIQSDITPKTFVEALWIAPNKDNKCVTIYAVVAVRPDIWYSFEGPLSRRLCEDRRKADDMQPLENENCRECEEARYEMLFEGMWSYNTHPLMYPKSVDLVRFSDVVGASHSQYFSVYKFNFEASEGLKMLAEQGNTTKLELEIQEELGQNVRTILKATGPPRTDGTAVTSFRVSPRHHLVSIATALLPSPDWFLGVSNLELCDVTSGRWANTVTLNLYPLDAGTDSGPSFDSSNDETSPPQPISSAMIAKDVPKEDIKPFARIRCTLIRTYTTELCSDATTDSTGGYGETDEGGDVREPTVRPVEPTPPPSEVTTILINPDTSDKCPMTSWGNWDNCEGNCEGGTRTGYQTRFRHHIVNGVAVRTSDILNVVPRECRGEGTEDFQMCTEPCEDEATENPEGEAETEAAAPYRRWRRWKPEENLWRRWNIRK